jgi:hypothetical protein
MSKPGFKAYMQPEMIKFCFFDYLRSVLVLVICYGISMELTKASLPYSAGIQIITPDKQLLLNGRIWRNQYSKAIGDPYFLSDTYLKGSVTFNGQEFSNLDLKYDIKNDELLLQVESHPTIYINKEMVDSFTLVSGNKTYNIINTGNDTSGVLRGYINVLYDGPSSLYVKYIKKLQPLAVDGRFDLFFQELHVYLRRGTEISAITGKRKFLELLEDKKREVRNYMKSRKLKIMRKDPDTLIPVLKFYDSIKN